MDLRRGESAVAARGGAGLAGRGLQAVEEFLAPAQRGLEVLLLHAPGAVVPGALLDQGDVAGDELEEIAAAEPDVLNPQVACGMIADRSELALEVALEPP